MAFDTTMTQGTVTGAFQFAGQPSGDDTFTLGSITYTWKADPSSTAYAVDIGSDVDDSIGNLVAAINASGTADDEYGDGTEAHPCVVASADLTNDEIDLTARGAGIWFDQIYLAASGTNLSVGGASVDACITAEDGTNGAGSLDDFIAGIFDLNQINGEVYAALAKLTDASD